jgi:hypothetical protein
MTKKRKTTYRRKKTVVETNRFLDAVMKGAKKIFSPAPK